MTAKTMAAAGIALAAGLTLTPAAAFAAEALSQELPLECQVINDSFGIYEGKDFSAADPTVGNLTIGADLECSSPTSAPMGEVREIITPAGARGWTLASMLVELVTYPADAYSETAFVVPEGGLLPTQMRLYAQPSTSAEVLAQLNEGAELSVVPGAIIEDSAASLTGTQKFIPARAADGKVGFVPEGIVASAPPAGSDGDEPAESNKTPEEKRKKDAETSSVSKDEATPPDRTSAALAAAKSFPEVPATFTIIGFILGLTAAIATPRLVGRIGAKFGGRRGGVEVPHVDEVDAAERGA